MERYFGMGWIPVKLIVASLSFTKWIFARSLREAVWRGFSWQLILLIFFISILSSFSLAMFTYFSNLAFQFPEAGTKLVIYRQWLFHTIHQTLKESGNFSLIVMNESGRCFSFRRQIKLNTTILVRSAFSIYTGLELQHYTLMSMHENKV